MLVVHVIPDFIFNALRVNIDWWWYFLFLFYGLITEEVLKGFQIEIETLGLAFITWLFLDVIFIIFNITFL